MNRLCYILILQTLILGCSGSGRDHPAFERNFSPDVLSDMYILNPPDKSEVVDSTLYVTAGKGTDFFNNPEDGSLAGSAPFFYRELTGDFVLKALVEPDFSAQWNAVALMVHRDSLNWIKFAFENSDATGPGIVSVVTRGSSDDANGVILPDVPRVWLALVRKKDIFAMHWSLDGLHYQMARLARLPGEGFIKAGIEAQCPAGEGATHQIHYFHLEERTVDNLRNLND